MLENPGTNKALCTVLVAKSTEEATLAYRDHILGPLQGMLGLWSIRTGTNQFLPLESETKSRLN